MKLKVLTLFAALSLSGCASVPALIGAPSSPAAVADTTVLDEKASIAVETLYTAVTRAGALAFRAGIVKPSSNPSVQRDDFCPRIIDGDFDLLVSDRGSHVMALECQLRAARDKTRAAYDAGNAVTYELAARQAIGLGRETLALIRGE